MMAAPRSAFEVRRQANGALNQRLLGYRAVQVLAYYGARISADGISPTYDEVCADVGIGSRGEVSRIVDSLERYGLMTRVGRGRSRRVGYVQTANLRGPIFVINGCPK